MGNPGSLVSNLGSECVMGFLWRSKGKKKMVAYSSIGHMGYVLHAAAATPFEPLASVPNDQPRTDLSAAVSASGRRLPKTVAAI